MGIFDKLFGASPSTSDDPRIDDFASLAKEKVAHGGERLSRRYWNSIYLGAYVPQIDMAVLKGTKLHTPDGMRLVQALHDLLGEDSIGHAGWTDDDADDLEGLSLSRMWTSDTHGIDVTLEVDNHHATDDPLMLSIKPWKDFIELVSSKE